MYIFLSDVDGTLVKNDAIMSEKVIEQANEFIRAGGFLTLCTGRSVVAASNIALRLGVNLPCILYGGAALYDFQRKKFFYVHGFPIDLKPAIAKLMDQHPLVSIQVFTKKDIYVIRRNRRLNEHGVKEENVNPLCNLSEVEGEIIKIVMCADDVEELASCQRYFPAEYCDFAFASKNFVDVVARNSSKADALSHLSEYYGVKKENFICAGDAITDLPMLTMAGLSFAPENALEQVKKAVDYVVPSVKENGMAEAFRIATDYIKKYI